MGEKPEIALALGGGARGLAHLGLIQAFEEAGIRPDLIVRSSAGAKCALFGNEIDGGFVECVLIKKPLSEPTGFPVGRACPGGVEIW